MNNQCLRWFESTHLSSVCLYLIYFHSPLFLPSLSLQTLWCMAGRLSISPPAKIYPTQVGAEAVCVCVKKLFPCYYKVQGEWIECRSGCKIQTVRVHPHQQFVLFTQGGKSWLCCSCICFMFTLPNMSPIRKYKNTPTFPRDIFGFEWIASTTSGLIAMKCDSVMFPQVEL